MADNKKLMRLVVRDPADGSTVIEQDEQGRWQWRNGAGLMGGGHLSRSDRALTSQLQEAVKLLRCFATNTAVVNDAQNANRFLAQITARDSEPLPAATVRPAVAEEDLHGAVFSGGIPAIIDLLRRCGVRVVR